MVREGFLLDNTLWPIKTTHENWGKSRVGEEYVYDPKTRQLLKETSSRSSFNYEYNNEGLLVKVASADTNEIQNDIILEYDGLLVKSIKYVSSEGLCFRQLNYKFNEKGWLTLIECLQPAYQPCKFEYTFSYDEDGRITEKSELEFDETEQPSSTLTHKFIYNNNHLERISWTFIASTIENGGFVDYSYDDKARLIKEETWVDRKCTDIVDYSYKASK